jgi:hypothetical protein
VDEIITEYSDIITSMSVWTVEDSTRSLWLVVRKIREIFLVAISGMAMLATSDSTES